VFDPEKNQIALLARGRGPVAVQEEERPDDVSSDQAQEVTPASR
jgi:hypothetical protein